MQQGNEGDEIILFSFRQIECPIPEDFISIGLITADLLCDIVARSLWLISEGDIKFNTKLPPNIASRHRICTDMANKIKELGFIGECGYNQLLYPVEKFSRTLLSWFIQKLPRSEDEGLEETLGANALLNRRIMESLKNWRISPKLLPFCTSGTPSRNIHYTNSFITTNLKIYNTYKENEIIKSRDLFINCSKSKLPIESSVFEKHTLEIINDAIYASKLENDFGDDEGENNTSNSKNKIFLSTVVRNALSAAKQNMGDSSLNNSSESKQNLSDIVNNISKNADKSVKKLERGTRFSHANEFAQDVNISIGNNNTSGNKEFLSLSNSIEEQAKKKEEQEQEAIEREKELEILRKEIIDSQNKIDAQERHNSNSMDKLRQLESELLVITTESERLERELMIKRKTLEMLPSATEHIESLQKVCSASSTKLIKLAQEWEGHRRPLLEQLRQKKSNKGQRRIRCRGMVEEMKKCREDMSTMIQDLKDKQERSQVLNEEMEKLPKNMNRSIYTHRIMDIISQISKQNKEIDKITVDIRDIQKTINSTQTSMQRADAVAEELVFTAADSKFSDPATVETYRSLRAMRLKFENLIDTVGKIGQIEKTTRDLETKVDQEMSRVSANNIDRIRNDLDQVQKENAILINQMKKLTGMK